MTIQVEKKEAITIITLDRPDARNAVDGPTAEALATAFRQFEADEWASVAVFVGANSTFCAGADLKAFAQESRRNRLEWPGGGPMGPSRMVLTKPVIGAISGYAVAGGMELALWCDMRVVEEDAIMGIFCRRWVCRLLTGVPSVSLGSLGKAAPST